LNRICQQAGTAQQRRRHHLGTGVENLIAIRAFVKLWRALAAMRHRHARCHVPTRIMMAYAAAIAFVALTGSFSTLHNADRFSARGLLRPISHR